MPYWSHTKQKTFGILKQLAPPADAWFGGLLVRRCLKCNTFIFDEMKRSTTETIKCEALQGPQERNPKSGHWKRNFQAAEHCKGLFFKIKDFFL